MNLKALVNFSYQNRSFKNGQEFTIDDENIADTLLKSGHVIETTGTKKVEGKKAK
jgi:hypothetical protein